jgi:hypothetical protein
MTDDPQGIPIARDEFRGLVEEYTRRIAADDTSFSAADYVTMIRLWNTIESGRLRQADPLFERFAAAFFPGQVQHATDVLSATPTKGMALYSREHDVYLGGHPHANSRYRVG